ncbi:hypothetical protein WJX75_002123 [Coccomyxa subellipsoidea]|uniref:AGC-kinase C-terminal domain-containing protein n=1 Tax=Coccomyxa subellipsoidea TaxID=248742 RepID=A0ABR2YGG2_9CHLO
MKPPHGFSFRGRPGPADEDNGDYMSLLELGQEQDMMDIPDSLLAQPSQPDKKIDADFFNSFQDDYDEDDMRPTT